MRQRLDKKLKNRHGETLIEVLAGVVIVALASTIFVSLVQSAANVNRKTEQADTRFYQAMSNLEIYTEGTDEEEGEDVAEKEGGNVTITLPIAVSAPDDTPVLETKPCTSDVQIYRQDDLWAYQPGGDTP